MTDGAGRLHPKQPLRNLQWHRCGPLEWRVFVDASLGYFVLCRVFVAVYDRFIEPNLQVIL